MFKILDMVYVRTIEKSCGFTFTKLQLEEARFNDGHISLRIDGKFSYFRIPVVTLYDLIQDHALSNNQNSVSPWE